MPGKILQNGKNGATLIIFLIVVTVLSSLGAVLMVFTHNRMMLCQLEIDKVKAITLAEAGVSQSIHELKTSVDVDSDGLGTIKKRKFGNGYFYVTHSVKNNGIRSTGVSNDVKRTIYVKYALN